MTKKKLAIYSFVLAVFVVLFSVYLFLVFRSADATNVRRLGEIIRTSEVQMEKNLIYSAKDLTFELNRVAGSKAEDLGAAQAAATAVERATGGRSTYVVDDNGVLHRSGSHLDGKKLELHVLKSAQASGYSAAGVPAAIGGTQDVALLVPFAEGSAFYLLQVYTPDEFLAILNTDLPISSTLYGLYNEWGQQISGKSTAEDKAQLSMTNGASLYSYNRQDNAFQKISTQQGYYAYCGITAPKSWFLGMHVEYEGYTGAAGGMLISTIIVFILLLITLLAVVSLDIINDREKKRDKQLAGVTDHLTGLISGSYLKDAVEEFLKKHPANNEYSLVYMDIVDFSRINSMLGFSEGDKLLQIIGSVIKEKYVCGSRANADRFVFLFKGTENVAEKIECDFGEAIQTQLLPEYMQIISFKFGVFPISEPTKLSFREIYDGAMLALKDAKKQNKFSEVVYDNRLKQSFELQKNIEMNMMHALSKEEFLVYVQPQFNMPGEECTRGETLIRWRSEYMGFLPPDQFISVFENNGFIVETDFFMLTQALEILQSRINEGLSPFTLAVNQSKVTISFPNYYERLKATVERFSVPLKYIELEVTESTLENDWETIVPLIHSVKKLGFSIAMDDFGSGFSSLNTLRILPIDILKIDKGFLQETDGSERSKVIIRNIINMAKQLHIRIVCEGVETESQLAFLKEAGCDVIQGYYYSKPLPLEEFAEKYLK